MTGKVGLYKEGIGSERQYRVRWFGKFDEATGKRKRYSRTFERKTDAERFKDEKKAEFKQEMPRDPTNRTLKEYAEQWLSDKARMGNLRPSTVLLYRATLDRLYGYFGADCLLRNINREAAKDFLGSVKPAGKRTKPLSDWSRHRVLRHCKTIFSEMARDRVIGVNPFTNIKVSSGTPSEWYYLKPDEFHKLLDVTPTLREKVLYCLAYTGGLRESEALSLYWTNIDFDKGRVCIVNRPATDDYPPFEIKDGDTRIIPLPKFTLDLLTQLHLESPEDVPFVLMDKQGCRQIRDKWKKYREQGRDWFNRCLANNVIRDFHRRVRQAGIETAGKNLTVHTLRKCCLQNWANSLPMNVVKELAGHSDIQTTNRFYSTVDEMHLNAAAKVGDNLLTTDLKMTFSSVSGENQRV